MPHQIILNYNNQHQLKNNLILELIYYGLLMFLIAKKFVFFNSYIIIVYAICYILFIHGKTRVTQSLLHIVT